MIKSDMSRRDLSIGLRFEHTVSLQEMASVEQLDVVQGTLHSQM